MSTFNGTLSRTIDHAIYKMSSGLSDWKPRQLESALARIRTQCNESVVDVRRGDRFDAALAALLDDGVSALSTLDHLVLAYGLSHHHDRLNGSNLLNHHDQLYVLLSAWTDLCLIPENPSSLQVWRGVLLSVFKSSSADSGLSVARAFLSETWPLVRVRKWSPQWLSALSRHGDLFGERPVGRYVAEWLRGSRDSVEELKVTVEIPESSWFWDDLVTAVVGEICQLPDDRKFREQIDNALDLRANHPRLADGILAQVLNRYASCANPSRHERVLSDVLASWNSPQLNLSTTQHRWRAASDDARRMVCGWLAEEDLQDFDELCRREQQVDGRRLKYWLRFKEQISYSRLVLGDNLRESQDADIRSFRNRKKGRLAWLTPQPSALNNAIILRIGGWWFVEFSEVGNACYPYKTDAVKLDFDKQRYSINELKSGRAVIASGSKTLIHRRDWEPDFDRFLADRDIWPDGVRSGASSQTAPRPMVTNTPVLSNDRGRPLTVQDSWPVIEPLRMPDEFSLPVGALTELGALGAKIVDHRSNGGAFWIEVKGPGRRLIKVLQLCGFRFVESRGFYTK